MGDNHPFASVLKRMAQLWECKSEEYAKCIEKNRPYMLCTHPVNLRAADLATLTQTPYVVGDKTDGERRFLLLDKDDAGIEYACTIDRKCTVNMLPSVRVADRALYAGTLLDCEYVPRDAVMVALDLVAVKGVTACHAPHAKRIGALHAVIPSIHTDGWRIVPKPWYPPSAIASIPGVEGLIFVPALAPMRYGTCKDVFKWKAVHTVDFLLFPDGRLQLCTSGRPVDVTDRFVLSGLNGTSVHARIIECSLHPSAASLAVTPQPVGERGAHAHPSPVWHLRYLKDRTDKTVPNDTSTLYSTMDSIRTEVSRSALNTAFN